jgi:hypothetical protein
MVKPHIRSLQSFLRSTGAQDIVWTTATGTRAAPSGGADRDNP